MSAFILRYKDTKDLFGLYAADTKYDLFDLIDEETDPFDYEFAALRFGYGIEFAMEKDRSATILELGTRH